MKNTLTQLPKAIFLDLDDTITSFDLTAGPAWEQSCKEFIEKYEPTFSYEELMQLIQTTKKWYWGDPERHKRGRENLTLARREVVHEALLRYAGDTYFQSPEKDTAAMEFADRYTELQDRMIQVLPGSREALDTMKKKGIRLAVITNGIAKKQREKLERFHLTEYFEEIFIDTEIGYSKPDARIFEYALNKMQLTASDVWMIGDNIRWDVAGPQAIGIFSVWVNTKKAAPPADENIQPDLYCDSLYEVSAILDIIG